jgi:hypothetical protein
MTKRKKLKDMTLEDYINLYADVDAYLASGGKLLDLPLVLGEGKRRVEAYPLTDKQRQGFARVGLFFKRLGALGDTNNRMGETVTEEQAREIWESTKVEEQT